MRAIKFRAKTFVNPEWVYGDLLNFGNNVLSVGCYTPNGYEMIRRIDPLTVGQFTGLTDRNGEEIYEGDVLAIEGIKYPRHYIVSWNTEKLMFCIGDTPLYALLEAGSTTMREYVVCGNIHDNHKLLKDEKD